MQELCEEHISCVLARCKRRGAKDHLKLMVTVQATVMAQTQQTCNAGTASSVPVNVMASDGFV